MSAFTGIFLKGIAWGALWHFSVYIIGATIRKVSWADVAGKTTGVVITYPFVEALVSRAAKLAGFSDDEIERICLCLFVGYFGAYLAGGIGKVAGTALDDWIVNNAGNAANSDRIQTARATLRQLWRAVRNVSVR